MRGGFVIVALFFSITIYLSAQMNPGARQIGLSNSDVAMSDDVFALFNNPAGLSQINWREIGFYYSPAPFGLKELSNAFFSYLEPTGFGNFAIGVMKYGFELYKENKICLSYSARFEGNIFAGLTINFHTLSIKNYGDDKTFSFDIGGLAYLLNNLRLGLSFQNVSRATFGNEKNQIPTILRTGLSYIPIDNTVINVAIEKESDYQLSLKSGLEYFPIKYISLLSGFSIDPDRFSFGIGIHYSIIELNYAVFTHPELGLTHQAGIIFNFSGDELRNRKIMEYLGFEE